MKSAIIILFLLLLLGAACDRKQGKVLLQIGSYTMTATEYESIKKNKQYSQLSTDLLHERLREEGLILAYALDHQYDTIKQITKQLEYIQRFYASTVDGYVWNKKVKPHLKVDEEALQKAYKRRNVGYDIDVILIPTREMLLEYLDPEVKVNTVEGFNRLKEEVDEDERIKNYTYTSHYPFNPMGIYLENLDQLNIGDVIGPLETLNGFFIVHVTNSKRGSLKPYEQEKSIIEQDLLFGLKEKYIWESQQRIFNEADPIMNEQSIIEMATKFDSSKKDWPGIDQDKVLMEYWFQGEECTYTASDFMEFVRHQPVFTGNLSDPNDVKQMLKTFLIGKFILLEAKEMGMEEDEEYLQWIKNRTNGVFVHRFKRKKILPELKMSEYEFKAYYDGNPEEFQCFGESKIKVYKHADYQQAMESRQLLQEQTQFHEKRTKESTAEVEIIEIKMPNEKYIMPIIETVIKQSPGGLSMPVKVGESFWLVKLLSKSGEGVIPYSLVRDRIRQTVLKKMEKEVYEKHISLLKNSYPIKVDLLDT
ncbi:peptidyl-prolyl cis-trans isomerase [Echinicola sp. CAU 1574]|uniref:peptidylprolyl isomerase n=1 Tax=Echinicola arenosa TaxID=2774144 RepID=A0ABR9APB2_9BACT|nr:peptidylprolyl isomerase [Echinicola arenosa]MBD8489454.1 peptidyl-prolyl cis-trans isomerase [Echinicola arenosa]